MMGHVSRKLFAVILGTLTAGSLAVASPATASHSPKSLPIAASNPVDLAQTTLEVDQFADNPASLWRATSSSGPPPSLSFASSGMTVRWPSVPRGTTLSAELGVTGADWSGYKHLRLTVAAADMGYHPVVTLTAGDGSSSAFRLSGPGARLRSAGPGWLQVDIPLGAATRPLLSRISKISISATARTGRSQNSLQIRAIDLVGSRGFYGPSTFVDPTLSTYTGRNWTDVAGRIHAQGFTAVHLIVLHFSQDFSAIINALHRVGLPVALTIYPTTNFEAYAAHPAWRQLSLGGESAFSWRVYLSPTNADFVRWLHSQIAALMRKYSFDGFTLNEPWYEVWGGPYRDNPSHQYYMDISTSARQAFEHQYGYDPVPALFLKDSSGVYYLNPQMAHSVQYRQWVQFRIDTIDKFMAGLAQTARSIRPGLPVFLTYIADVRVPGGYGKSPEYQAQDLNSMQTAVHPAGIIFETAWQDWLQPGLPPDYILDYTKAYVPQLHPGVAGLGQPDVGSVIKRNMAWLKQFSADCWQGGFQGYVIYEWSIGDWPTGGPSL